MSSSLVLFTGVVVKHYAMLLLGYGILQILSPSPGRVRHGQMPIVCQEVNSWLLWLGHACTRSMQQFERVLEQANQGIYDWGVAKGVLTAPTRQRACIALLETYLLAVLSGASASTPSVSIIEGVIDRCRIHLREAGTAFSLYPGSELTCQITEVQPLGKGGTGGGRLVFASDGSSVAKRGPGAQSLSAFVQVSGWSNKVAVVKFDFSSVNMGVQCGTTRRLNLRVKIHWNKYWLTTSTPASAVLAICTVRQQPKSSGAGHDTWLLCSQPLVDIQTDCKVQIQGLHPDLDGIHQVDKVDVQGHKVAIKAQVFSEAQNLDLLRHLSDHDLQQQPSLRKVQQINHSVVLHNSSILSVTVTESTGQETHLSALESFLRQSLPSAHMSQQCTPPQLLTQSPLNRSPEQHLLLRSVVADQQPYRRRRLFDGSTGISDQVISVYSCYWQSQVC